MTFQADASELESVRCPLCGTVEHCLLHDFSPYRVVRCLCCRAYYLSPRLIESAIRRLMKTTSTFKPARLAIRATFSRSCLFAILFAALLRQLQRRRLTGGALLEVGCGYGFLLDEAKGYFQAPRWYRSVGRRRRQHQAAGRSCCTRGTSAVFLRGQVRLYRPGQRHRACVSCRSTF